MNSYLTVIIIAALAVLHCIPAIVTLTISLPNTCAFTKKNTRKTMNYIVAAICAIIHVATYMVIHKFFLGRWNFLSTVKRIAELDFTYQDIDYLPVSLVTRLAMGFVLGWLIRFVLLKIAQKKYSYVPLSKKRIAIVLVLFCLVSVVSIGVLNYGLTGTQGIRINEVGVNNAGLDGDYIELYNAGLLDCVIYQLYLSDDSSYLKMVEIPATVLPSGEYLLIELGNGNLQINKKGGEEIVLSDHYGHILDRVTTVGLEPTLSYCRKTDGGEQWVEYTPTPGQSNAEGRSRLEQSPILSHQSGFYDSEFELQIQIDEEATIYYTLDGSIPTAESDVYTQPILVYNRSDEPNRWVDQQRVVTDWEEYTPDQTPVDKAFVVRAVAIAPDGSVSRTVTATYFVDMAQYEAGSVVCLVADPEDLWGDNGIYVTGKAYDEWYLGGQEGPAPQPNYTYQGKRWEREAELAYFSDGLSFSQPIGLRVTGGSSRGRAWKSFSIYARNAYSGSDTFDENIFPDVQSSRLAIRGGYANSVCQMLVPDRNVATQSNQRVAVFINGEFLYNANILEKYDAQYFYAHYGVSPVNLVVIKAGQVEEGESKDRELLQELYDYVDANDLGNEDSYAGFCNQVDIQSYIDYMCFNIYIDNMDFTEVKNSVWWRSRIKTANPYEDGKWRFCLYDLDAMEWGDAHLWGCEKQAEKNSFSLIPRYTDQWSINKQTLYVALKQNAQFRKQFVLTFMDLVNSNFLPEKALAQIDAYGENTDNYLAGNGGTRGIDYYKEFFMERADYIVPYMAQEFGLTGTLETVVLTQNTPQGGTLRINTIKPELTDGQWSGRYYTDYPVTIAAVAADGYRFVGWEGAVTSEESEIQVTLSDGGMTLHAVFEKIAQE